MRLASLPPKRSTENVEIFLGKQSGRREREKKRKMETKRKRLAIAMKKKRGRPQKIKQVEGGAGKLESSSKDGTGESLLQLKEHYGNASSLGPASPPLETLMLASPPLDTPMVAGCQTRSSEALGDEAGLQTPSRFPIQNDDGNPSENSALLLDLQSTHKNIFPDKTFSSKLENQSVFLKDALDLEKFTSDLFAKVGHELPSQTAPPCLEQIMVHDNLPETEGNVVSNISAHRPEDTAYGDPQTYSTRSSTNNVPTDEAVTEPENSHAFVGGYKVKKEMVPLLKAIFTKYGDIAKDSTFTVESRSCLLELVCSIYKRLEASKLMHLTPLELQSMLGQIGDLKLVNVEVGWLHKRLLNISKARELCEGASTLEDVKARALQDIDERQKAIENYENELESSMAALKKLQARLRQELDELCVVVTMADEISNFCDGSLVRGLV